MSKKTKSRKANKKRQQKKSATKRAHHDQIHAPLNVILQNAYKLVQQGNVSEAEQLFKSLQIARSNDPGFLNQLGVLAHMLGKSDVALKHLRKSVNLRPTAPFFNNLGLVQEQSDDLEGAQRSYKKAIFLDRNFPMAHFNLGNTLQKQSRYDDAITAYQKAILLKKDYTAAYSNMSSAQNELGKLDAAETSCTAALKIQPDYPEALNNWCNIMLQKKNPREVLASCEEKLEFIHRKDLLYGALGDTLADRGNKQEACKAYRNSLRFSATPGKIHLRMSMLKTYHGLDQDIIDMEQQIKGAADKNDKLFTCFALGKAYEDIGEYQQAFHFIEKGNSLSRATYSYSTVADKDFFNRVKSIFNIHTIQQFHGLGYRDQTPVFVVGMPRSGTTLIEHILASHSQVFGAGELAEMDRIIKHALRHDSPATFPSGAKQLNRQQFARIGKEYTSSIRKHSATAKRIVDKMPHNFFWLGLIHTALPDARIIHCKRDPMDTCWSIYKNIFDVPHKYAQDLVELGDYYKLYLDIMQYWNKVLPGKIYEIEYEKIVQNQEHETRKLLEYIDLQWEDACLNFHSSGRKVLTSSMSQVRNPIYSSSVNRWKCFEKELKSLLKIINE